MGAGRNPMQMMLQSLGLADLSRDLAVALRLTGLALQRLQLRGELADHIAEALKIRLGGLEAKLSLVEESAEPVARRRFTLSPGREGRVRVESVSPGVSSPAGSRRFRTPKPIRVPEAGVSER